MRSLSKIRGTMLGGAAGDALGFSVEFLSRTQIEERYGSSGILGYDMTSDIAIISDDTQLTMFTANALLLGKTRRCMRGEQGPYPGYLTVGYLDWLKTQHRLQPDQRHKAYCWIYHVPEMHHRRAPDATTMSALENRQIGTLDKPANQARGCAGLTRTAPIGLFFDPRVIGQKKVDLLGAECAAITHGHIMGWLPAAAFVHILSRIVYGGATADDLPELIRETCGAMSELVGEESAQPLNLMLRRVLRLYGSQMSDLDGIRMLGEGWQADEALAIGLFCALRYRESFGPGIIAAANHDGDSDSTAAITGSILGALLGAEQIPEFYLDSLELRDILEVLAYDLWTDCPMKNASSFYDEDWARKYIECRYDPL